MLDNLKKKREALVKFSFEDELLHIVEVNKDRIADLQATQLFSGVNAKGEPINPGYSPFTIQEKIKKGQPYDRVTYKDSGALYASLFTLITGKKFSIKSESFKFQKMVNRSGINVVGLNYQSRMEFIDSFTRPGIKRAYQDKVKNI
jgi:hypothetical protein